VRTLGTLAESESHRKTPCYGKRRNVGAYEQPFSGIGMEFEPLSGRPDGGLILHEAGYWAHHYNWNFPAVYSPFWRIYYDFAVGHAVRFGGHVAPLGPDRVVVIPNHQRFDCLGDPPLAKLWFSFSCDRNVDPGQRMPIVISCSPTIAAFVREFPPLFRGRRPETRSRIRQMSVSFVLYILARPEIRWQAPLPERIARILAMIDGAPGGTWTNASLAREARMSSDGFIRLFRQWLHNTPTRYVQQVRIREACRLLAGSDQSIKAIAAALGFANRYHFTRVFTALTGTSPGAYRDVWGSA
jgi:AraC-like DNA-binding protein